MNLAPVILFVYNRPDHTERTLESLSKNTLAPHSELFIYADGPKENSSAELLKKIEETGTVIRKKNWCGKVNIIESPTNKGLAKSVLDGVSEVIERFGKVIVLEDDLVTSPFFLQYMNDALSTYSEVENVACISAYIYPVKQTLPETFFIKGADCWGWGTWKRSWDKFEQDGSKLLKELIERNLQRSFDFNDTYPYTQMLADQIEGRNNSWAIRWYASSFLRDQYCLYPGKSLVQNIGIDGSGSHSGTSHRWDVQLALSHIDVKPIPVIDDKRSRKYIATYFKGLGMNRKSILKKIYNKLTTVFK
jgi:hypothetical protein